jgi:hypothetical protein
LVLQALLARRKNAVQIRHISAIDLKTVGANRINRCPSLYDIGAVARDQSESPTGLKKA